MENWVIFVLGLVLGIPLSILANVATPWVKSYFEKGSLTIKQRRIYILITRYRHIKKLTEDSVYLNLLAFRRMADLQSMTFLIVAVTGLSIMVKIVQLNTNSPDVKSITDLLIVAIVAYISSYFAMSYRADLVNALEFDKYKARTIAKLKKLGGNPEYLDKEESKED
jgi:hypothetical protein